MSSGWLSYGLFVYIIGFSAQILFSARLLVQWIQSEKVKKVLTPELFWELSLMASFLLFIYGWLRDDFAIMLGQSITYFIYKEYATSRIVEENPLFFTDIFMDFSRTDRHLFIQQQPDRHASSFSK
jgi:lipid-A-disaccharide synthase-like uncharacterized protein